MAINMKYDDFLKHKEAAQGKIKKGERTRNRIKISVAKLLNVISYSDLRVVDICNEAKIAPGTFYIYFENSSIVVEQVLSEFIDMYFEIISQIHSDDPFESIHLANMAYLENARTNPGLTRCVFGMRIDYPEFSKLHQEANSKLYSRIAKNVTKHVSGTDYEVSYIAVHAMGSMMDEVAGRIAFNDGPYMGEIFGAEGVDDEGYCECLSVIWYRTLYGKLPTNVKTDLAKRFMKIGT